MAKKKRSTKRNSNKRPQAPSPAPGKGPVLPLLFTLAAGFACIWAWYLIGVHYEVQAKHETGGLIEATTTEGGGETAEGSFFTCGEGEGCDAVLNSPDSEFFGAVPVSVPAVPLFGILALLGLMTLLGRFERDRLSGIAGLFGLGGLAFGGYLLVKMLLYYELCRFCLIMDGSNLLVLVLGLALHSEGLTGGLRAAKGTLGRFAQPGMELGIAVGVLALSVAVHTTTVDRAAAPAADGVVQGSGAAPAGIQPGDAVTGAGPAAGTAATPAVIVPDTAEATGSREAPATASRRVVLPADKADIKIGRSVPTRGPKTAPVTIVLFEDFQCPYCKKLSGNIEALLEDPEVKDDVRVAFMHFPMHGSCNANELKKNMHRFACGAATASVCAQEQGQFWEMHDVLFRNNQRLRTSNLKGYAKDLGLDMDAFNACLKDPATADKVRRDSLVGGQAGVTGTPSLFINGSKLVGAQPVEALKAVVLLEKAGRGDERVLLDVDVVTEVVGDVSGAAPTVSFSGPNGSFQIDAFEASVTEGKALSRPGVSPARNVTWYQADAACKASGKRLCSEVEWLQACTGEVPIDED